MDKMFGRKKTGKKALVKPKPFRLGSTRHSIYECVIKEFERSGRSILEKVKLPEGRSKHDWFNVHVRLFFQNIFDLYVKVEEDCYKNPSCQQMTIEKVDQPIIWIDYHDPKQQKHLSAYEYIGEVFKLADGKTEDQKIFPEDRGINVSSEELLSVCKRLCTEFFRVMGHIYRHHTLNDKDKIDFDRHYEHILAFVREHDLIGRREIDCMKNITREVVERITNKTPSVIIN